MLNQNNTLKQMAFVTCKRQQTKMKEHKLVYPYHNIEVLHDVLEMTIKQSCKTRRPIPPQVNWPFIRSMMSFWLTAYGWK